MTLSPLLQKLCEVWRARKLAFICNGKLHLTSQKPGCIFILLDVIPCNSIQLYSICKTYPNQCNVICLDVRLQHGRKGSIIVKNKFGCCGHQIKTICICRLSAIMFYMHVLSFREKQLQSLRALYFYHSCTD